MERISPGSLFNEKARYKSSFWGLRFELRDWIANIHGNSLNELANVAANLDLILEQEREDKKGSFVQKLVYLLRMCLSSQLSKL